MKKQILWTVLVLSFILASCTMPNQATPTDGAGAVYTAAAETVSAMLTAAVTATSPLPTATVTPEPSGTATVTQTQPPTNTLAPVQPTAAPQVCDKAAFVADVTIPDGTLMKAGEEFTKTWRLKNVGTCTWTTDYAAVFKYEEKMGAPSTVDFTKNVAPGETIDISVDLVAPDANGQYTGYWILRNADGKEFSSGGSRDGTFYVQIKVGSGSSATTSATSSGIFAVTSVSTTAGPANYSGPCAPVNVTLTASITVNKAGSVTYYWKFSDSTKSETYTLKFTEAGTKTVEYVLNFTLAAAKYDNWASIYIDNPNHQEFSKANYTLNCTD